jgi:hypothetical protein
MAQFELGKEIVTADPTIQVEPTLAIGKHVFQLIVEDAAGNQSAPTSLEVIVLDKTAPTAVLELVGASPVEDEAFVLSAAKSADARGGTIVAYRFTLTSRPEPPRGPDPVPPHPIDPPLGPPRHTDPPETPPTPVDR